MTTNTDQFDAFSEESSSVLKQAHDMIAHIEKSRAEQPQRLAKARKEADEARGWAVIEEPWADQLVALPAIDKTTGERTGNALTLPSIVAKELFGARLAFDMLDCGDDFDRIDEVQNRYFTESKGDTGLLFLVAFSALSTIASVVVPRMLDDVERHGSNYDARVLLAEARAKAWRGRVSELNGHEHRSADESSDGDGEPA